MLQDLRATTRFLRRMLEDRDISGGSEGGGGRAKGVGRGGACRVRDDEKVRRWIVRPEGIEFILEMS